MNNRISTRPYANAKEFMKAEEIHGKWFTKENEEWLCAVSVRETMIIALSIDGMLKIPYSMLARGYYWAKDGSPCLIEIDEEKE